MTNELQLTSGATIDDVYAAFLDAAYGECGVTRTRNELRDVIHASGLRYEECDKLYVSYEWAQCQTSESGSRTVVS